MDMPVSADFFPDPEPRARQPGDAFHTDASAPEVPSALEVFLVCAHQMLDSTTPEPIRRQLEPRLLAQLPLLRALGVFQLFAVRDPALRRMLEDEWGGSLES